MRQIDCTRCLGRGYIIGPLGPCRCPKKGCKAGRVWEKLTPHFYFPLNLQEDIVRIQEWKEKQ